MLQVVVANIVVGVTSEPRDLPSGSPHKADGVEFDRVILMPAMYRYLGDPIKNQSRPFRLFNPATGEMFVGCWFHQWDKCSSVSDGEDVGWVLEQAQVLYEARGPRQEFMRPAQEIVTA